MKHILLLFHFPLVVISAFVHDLRSPRSSSFFDHHHFRNTERQPSVASSFFDPSSSALSASSYDYSKWDNLTDDDEDDDKSSSFESSPFEPSHMNGKRNIPPDMEYNAVNTKRQAQTYNAISKIGDPNLISTVWFQCPADDDAWFVGWVAHISDVTGAQAIERQYPIIERHAWALRSNELHPSRGPFAVYVAKGGIVQFTEVDTVSSLEQVHEEDVQGASSIDRVCVGFVGALYDDTECDARGYRLEVNLEEEENMMTEDEFFDGLDVEEKSLNDESDLKDLKNLDVDYDDLDFRIPDTAKNDFQ